MCSPFLLSGGDLRSFVKGGPTGGIQLIRLEYSLNFLLRHLTGAVPGSYTRAAPPLQSLVVMRGIVMGGGAGLAMGCRVRVCTDTTTFAMPEVRL